MRLLHLVPADSPESLPEILNTCCGLELVVLILKMTLLGVAVSDRSIAEIRHTVLKFFDQRFCCRVKRFEKIAMSALQSGLAKAPKSVVARDDFE
jgi:hypothetical protein